MGWLASLGGKVTTGEGIQWLASLGGKELTELGAIAQSESAQNGTGVDRLRLVCSFSISTSCDGQNVPGTTDLSTNFPPGNTARKQSGPNQSRRKRPVSVQKTTETAFGNQRNLFN